jgi:hypothetical protein
MLCEWGGGTAKQKGSLHNFQWFDGLGTCTGFNMMENFHIFVGIGIYAGFMEYELTTISWE